MLGTNEFARGWRVLLAAFFGISVSISSVLFYTFGLWIVPWQEEFGWSRAQIGGAQGVAAISLIMVVPLVGLAIDRFGIRRIAITSMLLFAASTYAAVFLTGSIWMLYGLMVLFAVTGAGASPVAFTRVVNGWFAKNRGLALGLALMSTGIAAAVLPALLAPYTAEHGWRAGITLLSLIIAAPVILVVFWVRDSGPEDTPPSGIEEKSGVIPDLKRGVFKKLGVMFFLIAFGVCGLIPSFIPMLLDAGVSAEATGRYTAAIGISVIIGRLFTGFMVDRVFAPYVTFVLFSCAAAGLLVSALGGVAFAFVGAIALGFAIGAEVDLIGYYAARYFGTQNYGVLFGILYSCFSAGCAFSPLVAGYIWDKTQSYDIALFGAAGLLGLAAITALTLPRFEPKHFR